MARVRSSVAELDRVRLWHPFTQQADWERDDPLVIAAGEGSWLIDENGRRYLDGNASLWVNVHGHRRPEIDAAVREQLDRIAHTTFLGLTNPPAVAFADALLQTTPPASRAPSSRRAARAPARWPSSSRCATRSCAASRDARASSGCATATTATRSAPSPPGASTPSTPPSRRCSGPPCTRRARSTTRPPTASPSCSRTQGDEVFAVIVEPLIQAAAGILVAPDGWLARARALCDAAGCLLICDEVAVGLGRTGTFWASQREDVAPDILCCGKGLTGGYLPLSATLVREELYESFLGGPERTFYHGHSYSGNPLACAAACASLALYEQDGTLANVARQSARLRARLEAAPYPLRGHGLLLAVVGGGAAVCRAARRHGLVIRPLGEAVVVCPPLSISDEESDLLADALLAAYADAA